MFKYNFRFLCFWSLNWESDESEMHTERDRETWSICTKWSDCCCCCCCCCGISKMLSIEQSTLMKPLDCVIKMMTQKKRARYKLLEQQHRMVFIKQFPLSLPCLCWLRWVHRIGMKMKFRTLSVWLFFVGCVCCCYYGDSVLHLIVVLMIVLTTTLHWMAYS